MRHGRGFRLRDGLLMIAVIAVGLTWARESWDAIRVHEGTFSDWSYQHVNPALRWGFRRPRLVETSLYDSARGLLASALYVSTAVAAVWAVALVAIDRLRRPRSRIWRARRPGAIACLAATAVLILTFLGQVIRPCTRFNRICVTIRGEVRCVSTSWGEYWMDDYTKFGPHPLVNAIAVMPRFAGFVVAGAWIAVALAGAWKPEPTWVDRAGRLIGAFWLLAAAHFLVFPL